MSEKNFFIKNNRYLCRRNNVIKITEICHSVERK